MAKKGWLANDGTFHFTRESAEACEAYGEYAEVIDRYVATIDTSDMTDRASKSHLTRTRTTLIGFLRWENEQGSDSAHVPKEIT